MKLIVASLLVISSLNVFASEKKCVESVMQEIVDGKVVLEKLESLGQKMAQAEQTGNVTLKKKIDANSVNLRNSMISFAKAACFTTK